MNREDFESFVASASFEAEHLESRVEETHISWISFSKKYVFKIKKPVKLSFLDFSSLDQRKKYCERELMLNQRFSKIYLDVLPVLKKEGGWSLGKGEGEIQDYAVRMLRMASHKRMDKMLRQDKVSKKLMYSLAKEVARFHQKAEVVKSPFNLKKSQDLFNDIEEVTGFIERELGKDQKKFLIRSMVWSNEFLQSHASRFQERIDKGYKRDVHGDLHAGNIFLYRQPVLFDCIEFNDEFRQIDLLYEIAFLSMELDVEGHEELSRQFLTHYLTFNSCLENKEDIALYHYFQCLRANVRAKVRAIAAAEAQREAHTADVRALKNYLALMAKYMELAEKMVQRIQ